jgi:hypothetical protein
MDGFGVKPSLSKTKKKKKKGEGDRCLIKIRHTSDIELRYAIHSRIYRILCEFV